MVILSSQHDKLSEAKNYEYDPFLFPTGLLLKAGPMVDPHQSTNCSVTKSMIRLVQK